MSAIGVLARLANGALMVGLPIVLAIAWRRATGARWLLLAGGALAFVGSQVVHLPLLGAITWAFRAHLLPAPPASWVYFDALTLGFFAAACEEPARAILFARFFRRDRDARAAVMAGLGHGGIEAVIFGLLVLLTLLNMIVSRDLDASQLTAMGVAPEQAEVAAAQIRDYWALPAGASMLGALERALTVPFHVACSVLVAAAVRERRAAPFVIAFSAHWASDTAAVIASQHLGALETEGVIAALVIPFVAAVALWAIASERRSGAQAR